MFDDDGQYDGESVGAFSQSMRAQPWLAQSEPPWHLWGNVQATPPLLLPVGAGGLSEPVRSQITAIRYGRPETWHWLFTARVVQADDADPGEPLALQIVWELIVGVGRAVQQTFAFDVWNLFWGTPVNPSDAAPVGTVIWTTETVFGGNPNREGNPNVTGVAPRPNVISEIVAQDITLNVRAALQRAVSPGTNPKTATIEFGAQWAPKTHIRPDWFQDRAPNELRFPGGEVRGR